MDYTIYLIENTVNHKLYVGLTGRSVERRWQRHRSNAGREDLQYLHLYRAMSKHGTGAFDFMELTWASTREEANRLETEWIERLGTFEYGYNQTRGGDGVSGVAGETHAMAKEADEEALQLIREWHLSGKSVRAFTDERGMNHRRLTSWLNGRDRPDLLEKYKDRFGEAPREPHRNGGEHYRSDEEVVALVNEYRTTKKTMREICEEHDVSYSNLSGWHNGKHRPHLQEQFADAERTNESGVTDEEVVEALVRYRCGEVSQKQLAAELDVSTSLVSAWNTGKQRPHLQDRIETKCA